jgi:hypothetical protein
MLAFTALLQVKRETTDEQIGLFEFAIRACEIVESLKEGIVKTQETI